VPKNQETTTKFKVDISELKKQFSEAQRQIRLANSEFKAATAGMDNWSKSADGLSAKIKQLHSVLDSEKTKLASLEKQYAQVASEQGDTSKGAQELAIKINNQKAAVAKIEKSLDGYEGALRDVSDESADVDKKSDNAEKGIEDVGDAAKNSDGKVSGFASKLGELAKTGLAAVATAATGVVTAFLGSAEATREFRVAMGKVNTAFTEAGFSAKTGKKTFEDFAAILGDTDQATEAVGNLAKLATSQKDLSKWTTIATGVYATFGDGLPIEGLTEAANETAKVAQITGPLADAINWSTTSTEEWNKALSSNDAALAAFNKGIAAGENAEDSFNLALKACNSEQERSQLITATLTSLYGDAAKAYEKTNGAIMDANRAQAQLNGAMAEVGAAAEPIMTTLKLFGVEILTSLLPSVKQLAGGFTDLTNGVDGADKKIGEAISNILTTLVGKITDMLPTIGTVGVNLILSLINGIVSCLPQLATSAVTILGTLANGIIAALPQLATSAVEILNMLVNGLIAAAPQLISTAGTLLKMLYQGIMTGIPMLINLGAEMLTKLGEGIGNNLPTLTSKALDALDGFADMLTKNLPTLLNAGISFITNLVKGIMNSLPVLIKKGPDIITKFANIINKNMPTILKAAVNIIVTIVKGIIKAIPILVKNIPKIIKAFVAVWEAFNWLSLGKKAITFLKDGILKMVGAVKGAAKSVMSGATNALKSLPGKLLEVGKNAVKNLGSALASGVSTVKTKAASILKGIVSTFKPNSLVSVGKDLIKGLWNGISDMSGWIADKIGGFSKGVLKGIKKFFGIHSPSTVMRDQVGKQLVRGMAEGITDEAGTLNKSLTTVANNGMKALKASLKKNGPEDAGKAMITSITNGITKMTASAENSVTKVVNSMVKKAVASTEKSASSIIGAMSKKVKKSNSSKVKSEYSQLASEYKKMGKAAVTNFTKAYEEQAKKASAKMTASIEKLAKKAQEKYDEVLSKQNKLQSNAENYGDLYTTDDDGNIVLSDIKSQTGDIKKFAGNLAALKGKVSQELMDQIAQMDVGEGLAFTNKLLSLSNEDLKAYDAAYSEKLKTSRQIAKNFYSKELKAIKTEFTDKVEEKLKALKKKLKKVGQDAASGFIKGFNADTDDMKKAVKNFSKSLISQIKKELGIHSPSTVMRDQVGKFLPLGVAEGITKNVKPAVKAMSDMASALIMPAKSTLSDLTANNRAATYRSGVYTAPISNVYNFNQTNNSPKPLSRLEIYRQTRNQLALLKEV